MTDLHNSLKALSPCKWSELPSSESDLEPFLHDIFSNAHNVVESVPIEEPNARPRSQSKPPIGVTVTTSSARSASPSEEHEALQKEWGKPVKLSVKDNPMGMSVYKMSCKDGRGAWFARRSVHTGLGFTKFKQALQQEFPESLAVQGGPGEGKVRGIGAEKRLEEGSVPLRGKVEVLRLTAQFPGPTTPRDFVTLLATSEHRVEAQALNIPRQYMVISKPCEHDETQPTTDFIRGWYESIEYIREIPRQTTSHQSSPHLTGHAKKDDEDLLKTALRKVNTDHQVHHSKHDTPPGHSPPSKELSATSPTVDTLDSKVNEEGGEDVGDESNPVEWIMVTRSDPGGSVPRFMVERGTPAGICADARKFLEWASQHADFGISSDQGTNSAPTPRRTRSYIQYEQTQEEIERQDTDISVLSGSQADQTATSQKYEALNSGAATTYRGTVATAATGLLGSVAGVVSAYAPKVILDHIPHSETNTQTTEPTAKGTLAPTTNTTDVTVPLSPVSSVGSYASAESRISDDKISVASSKSLQEKAESGQKLNEHEHKLLKLSESKKNLVQKFHHHKEKTAKKHGVENMDELEEHRQKNEKLAREMSHQEEKHTKELAKIEEKKARAIQKMKEKKRKDEEKDQKHKLTIERDEARAELELIKKERHVWHQQIAQLQKENASLITKITKLEKDAGLSSSIKPDESVVSIPNGLFNTATGSDADMSNASSVNMLQGSPVSRSSTPKAGSPKMDKKK